MVGRPKEFNETEALQRAMEVFWDRGYEATSVQDLLEAMCINRGSMYDTFGDKRSLFLAAIEEYGRSASMRLEEALSKSRSPLADLRRLLTNMGCPECGSCRGCFTTNCIVELAPHDPEVAGIATQLLKRMEKTFASALRRAIDAGEISRSTDVRAAARFLVSTAQGLIVMSKAAASPAVVRDAVKIALSALE